MKRKYRIYLDTSFWGRLTESSLQADRRTTYRFLNHACWRQTILISPLVFEELKQNPHPTTRRITLRRVRAVSHEIIPNKRNALSIATALMTEGGFTPKMIADLTHLGYSILGGADAVVTWNMRTMARSKVRMAVHAYCQREGRVPPLIGDPEEVARWLGLSI